MATTLQSILSTIRAAYILNPGQVIYGITDGLAPPYISVQDYEATQTYDTSGPTIRESSFRVLVLDKSQDIAETIATRVDTLLNNSTTLTPQCMRCFQDSYKVGQLAEQLYQFGVEIKYTLHEDMKI